MAVRFSASVVVSACMLVALVATFGFKAYLLHQVTGAARALVTQVSENIIDIVTPKDFQTHVEQPRSEAGAKDATLFPGYREKPRSRQVPNATSRSLGYCTTRVQQRVRERNVLVIRTKFDRYQSFAW